MPNGLTALAWDPAAWAADPVAYARSHLDALAAAHRAVTDEATRAMQLAAAERVLDANVTHVLDSAGIHRIGRVPPAQWRALAAALPGHRRPAEVEALAFLAHATRALRPPTDSPVSDDTDDTTATWEEIDADLGE